MGTTTTVQELVDDGTLYMQLPGLATAVPGKPWVSMTLTSGNGAGAGAGLGALIPGWATTDPLAVVPLLQKLQAIGGKVQTLGPATQNGKAVTRYRVTFDRTAIVKMGKSGAVPSLGQTATGLEGITLGLAVDSTGLLTSVTADLGGRGGGTNTTVTIGADFSTYGAPISISPPRATQVTSFQKLLQTAASSKLPLG